MLTVGHFGHESEYVSNDHTNYNSKLCDSLFLVCWQAYRVIREDIAVAMNKAAMRLC